MAGPRRLGVYVNLHAFDNIYCSYRRWKSERPGEKRLLQFRIEVKVILESHTNNPEQRLPSYDCILEFSKLLDRVWRDKIIVSLDDPELPIFKAMDAKGLINLSLLPDTGAEFFSFEMFNWFKIWLTNSGLINHVDVRAVEVIEHYGVNIVSASLYSE